MAKKTKDKITLATPLVEVVNLYAEQNKYNNKKQVRTAFLNMYNNVCAHIVKSKTNVALGKFDNKALTKFDKYLLDNYSNNTRLQYYNALKAAINSMIAQTTLNYSTPFSAVPRNERPRKEKNNDIKYLSVDEIARVKEGVNLDNEVERAFLFSYYTGLRLSDIRTLNTRDIKTINGVVTIVKKTQKTSSRVVVPLSADALKVLNYRVASKAGYYFRVSEHNKTIHRELQKMFARIDVDFFNFHCARHTFAVQCVRNGVRIEVISKALGHSNISTTQIYAEVDEFTAVEALQVANL